MNFDGFQLFVENITRMDIKNLNRGQIKSFARQIDSWEYAFFLLFARLANEVGFKSPKGLEYLNLMKDIQKTRLQHGFGIGKYNLDAIEAMRNDIDFYAFRLKLACDDMDKKVIWEQVKRCLGEEEIIKRINIKAKREGDKGIVKQEKIGDGDGVRFNLDMFLGDGISEEYHLCWVPMWERKNIKFEFDTYFDKCNIEISVIDWIFEDVLYEFCDEYMGEGHFSNNEDRLDWFKNRVNDVKLLQDKLISSAQELQMIRLAQKYEIIHNELA